MRALAGEAGPTRTRALWSLARIGGEQARARLQVELDAGDPAMFASLGLLELPVTEPGAPPTPEGAWAELEDALWTRYAVTDPAAQPSARALLFALARLGGPRSMQRFAVDLAEQPTRHHPPHYVARWTASMEALGLACARGLPLDEAGVGVIVDGLEREDPEAARAAVYALGRCARSSSELLAESREAIITRLTPFTAQVGELDEGHAALAWKALAALGDRPSTIDAGLFGAREVAPVWWVEVEAARALGESREGRELVRTRLAERTSEDFVGGRMHVPIVALQAMRAGIATDAEQADAELVRIASWLSEGRRSADARVRKASALALCELRLLQAIRSGTPELVERCDRSAEPGAGAVTLPPGHVAGLEVEALLRATRASDPGTGGKDLGTVAISDEAVIADLGEPPPEDPLRRARVGALLTMAQHADPSHAAPALQALAEIDDSRVAEVLRAALQTDDVGVLAAATTAIAVRSIDAGKRDLQVVPLLEAIVRDRRQAGALEARLSAIEALGVLAHEAVTTLSPTGVALPDAPAGEPDWLARTIVPLASAPELAVRRKAREALLGHPERLASFDAIAERGGERAAFHATLADELARVREAMPIGLRVETDAGAFTIAFTGVEAPLNLANLITLVEAGYFEGLGFHRVVPGFVVQGGDPRGDGYGGPGWLVPCEWSNLRYVRGSVGIALAGKDTGGSQFFVTQTAQPHLEGRYTVIGQVDEEGMAVVDQLLPGDRIVRIEVLRE